MYGLGLTTQDYWIIHAINRRVTIEDQIFYSINNLMIVWYPFYWNTVRHVTSCFDMFNPPRLEQAAWHIFPLVFKSLSFVYLCVLVKS